VSPRQRRACEVAVKALIHMQNQLAGTANEGRKMMTIDREKMYRERKKIN